MEINQFVELFKIKMEELLNSDIITSSKYDDYYNPGDWTFMFNCATYDLIKEYNKKHKTNFSICAEPDAEKTPSGRGAYSDILICSSDKKEEYITIEHKNFPKYKLLDIAKKLSNSKAKGKLLITYFFNDTPKKKIVKELKIYVTKFFRKGEKLHLLIGPYNIGKGNQYQLKIIHAI